MILGYRLEPVGAGLGIGLARELRKLPISPVDNPMALIELLSSRQTLKVSLMIIVSGRDGFTPLHDYNLFEINFLRLTR